MAGGWVLSRRTLESVSALTRRFWQFTSRDGALWQVFALVRGSNQPSLLLFKEDHFPLRAPCAPQAPLPTWHMLSGPAVLSTPWHTSAFMCFRIGLSSLRTVLFGSARECDGFRYKRPSYKKSGLVDLLTRWEAQNPFSCWHGANLCDALSRTMPPRSILSRFSCGDGRLLNLNDLDVDSLLYLRPSSSNSFNIFIIMWTHAFGSQFL